jgi:adenylate kinase family enzyme
MSKSLNRLHIIGGPGSGKSELAARLAALIDAPTIQLDDIAFHGGASGRFDNPTTRVSRIKLVDEYSSEPRWIAEGVYFSWVGKSFREAHQIIVLKTPEHIRAHNIRQRMRARGKCISTADHLNYLLQKNCEYDLLFQERIAGFLIPFQDKVRVFSGSGKAYKHFQRVLTG